ncbi:MAG: ATP-binding protein [Pseudomonadota bacterium]
MRKPVSRRRAAADLEVDPMVSDTPTLHMICGKIAAGKSTLAARLAQDEGTVLIVLDDWLGTLFGDQIKTGADFLRFGVVFDRMMGPHIVSLLKAGVSVVLDYPANTVAQRARMRTLFEAAGAAHVLHVLDVPDDACLARLKRRNAQREHAFTVSAEQFHRFTEHFALPGENEGFKVMRHDI